MGGINKEWHIGGIENKTTTLTPHTKHGSKNMHMNYDIESIDCINPFKMSQIYAGSGALKSLTEFYMHRFLSTVWNVVYFLKMCLILKITEVPS